MLLLLLLLHNLGRRIALARPLCTGGAKDAAEEINFLDHRPVHLAKTRQELLRSLVVLWICSIDVFASNAQFLMHAGRRLLGRRGFGALMRRSFFGQFVGGETEAELRATVEDQRRHRIMPMIAVPMEEPVGRLREDELARLYEGNTVKLVRAVELSAELNDRQPKMQLKVTSLMPTSLLRALAAGCSQTPATSPTTVAAASALADLLSGQPSHGRTPQSGGLLADVERQFPGQLALAADRVRRVFDAAARLSVQVLIDAEYSDINSAISLFYLALALRHNTGTRCLVYNTYQCYLRDGADAYTGQTDFLLARGVGAGAKIVRGAYLDWENRQGAEMNSGRSPAVWSSQAKTDASYNRVVAAALDRVMPGPAGRHEIILATHNAASINLCLEGMRDRGVPNDSQLVSFGQLYGMADNISLPLSKAGCRVYKSIPYGSVEETLPYLARRASENSSIFVRVCEERSVLRAALWAGR